MDSKGIAHIKTTFNNTLVTITNSAGQTICWSSAGKLGFKGAKKNTPYAGQRAAAEAAQTAKELGVEKVEVRVKGPGAGREAAVRSIHNEGVDVTVIKDVTPLPHNGCRPPKQRRV